MTTKNAQLDLLVKNLDAMDRYYSQRPIDEHIGTLTAVQIALRDVRSAIVYAKNGLVWQGPPAPKSAALSPSVRPGISEAGKA
jgi:hypothetical protein